jgi:membrane fusion protein (multidrug efflux system)
MKKILVLCGTFAVIALIVLVLFKNRADVVTKSKVISITKFPVTVVKAVRQNLNQNLAQVGVIVAQNDVSVVSVVQGKVTAVMAQPGMRITAGAPIVRVENDVSQSKLSAAETAFEKARQDWVRQNQLYQQNLIAKVDVESSKMAFKSAEANYAQAKHDYQSSVIVAPITGIVASRPVDLGTMLNSGTVVADVVDNSQFKMTLDVAETYAFKLHVGDAVNVRCDVYPGVSFSGRIKSISIKGSAAHTYPVEIAIANTHQQAPLKSGMFGTVEFNLALPDVLTIPRATLVGSLKTPQVYRVEQRKAKLQALVLGPEIGTNVVVLKGLNEGDTIVASGQNNLKDGIAVKVMRPGFNGLNQGEPWKKGGKRGQRHERY